MSCKLKSESVEHDLVELENEESLWDICMYVCMYIYIYIYIINSQIQLTNLIQSGDIIKMIT